MGSIRGVDLAAFATSAGSIVLLASDQGGFFPHTWPWAGLGFAAVGALALGTTWPLRATRAQIVLVAGLAALAAWTALSAVWSSEPTTSLQEAVRTPVYAAAALAFVTLAAAGGARSSLVGVSCSTTGIAAYSLADRAVHGIHPSDVQGALLEYPLGYANALGVLCAIGLVVTIALGLGARRQRPAAAILFVPAAAVLTVALVRTSSSGSVVAAVAGAVVALALAVGRRWAAVAAGLLAALLGGVYIVTAFTEPSFLAARGDYWHVAWHSAARHPLIGDGAGTYDLAWAAFGDVGRFAGALDAHSLYLETPAELGVVGLLLVCALLVPVVSALHGAPRSPTSVAALGGAVTFLVHAGLDWDWEMPAVMAAGLVCLAALPGRPESQLEIGSRLRLTGLGVAVATIIGYIVLITARIVQ